MIRLIVQSWRSILEKNYIITSAPLNSHPKRDYLSNEIVCPLRPITTQYSNTLAVLHRSVHTQVWFFYTVNQWSIEQASKQQYALHIYSNRIHTVLIAYTISLFISINHKSMLTKDNTIFFLFCWKAFIYVEHWNKYFSSTKFSEHISPKKHNRANLRLIWIFQIQVRNSWDVDHHSTPSGYK